MARRYWEVKFMRDLTTRSRLNDRRMGLYYQHFDRMNPGLKCAKVFPGCLRSLTLSLELCCKPRRDFDIYDGQPSLELANLVQDGLNFTSSSSICPQHIGFIPTLLNWTILKTAFLVHTILQPSFSCFLSCLILGSHILHNLQCHLQPAALYSNLEE
jgi:hypothetical protein